MKPSGFPTPTKIQLKDPPKVLPKKLHWKRTEVMREPIVVIEHIATNVHGAKVSIIERHHSSWNWSWSVSIQTEATDGPWARQEQSLFSLRIAKDWARQNLREMGLQSP